MPAIKVGVFLVDMLDMLVMLCHLHGLGETSVEPGVKPFVEASVETDKPLVETSCRARALTDLYLFADVTLADFYQLASAALCTRA